MGNANSLAQPTPTAALSLLQAVQQADILRVRDIFNLNDENPYARTPDLNVTDEAGRAPLLVALRELWHCHYRLLLKREHLLLLAGRQLRSSSSKRRSLSTAVPTPPVAAAAAAAITAAPSSKQGSPSGARAHAQDAESKPQQTGDTGPRFSIHSKASDVNQAAPLPPLSLSSSSSVSSTGISSAVGPLAATATSAIQQITDSAMEMHTWTETLIGSMATVSSVSEVPLMAMTALESAIAAPGQHEYNALALTSLGRLRQQLSPGNDLPVDLDVRLSRDIDNTKIEALVEIIDLLLYKGCDLQCRDHAGWTALHYLAGLFLVGADKRAEDLLDKLVAAGKPVENAAMLPIAAASGVAGAEMASTASSSHFPSSSVIQRAPSDRPQEETGGVAKTRASTASATPSSAHHWRPLIYQLDNDLLGPIDIMEDALLACWSSEHASSSFHRCYSIILALKNEAMASRGVATGKARGPLRYLWSSTLRERLSDAQKELEILVDLDGEKKKERDVDKEEPSSPKQTDFQINARQSSLLPSPATSSSSATSSPEFSSPDSSGGVSSPQDAGTIEALSDDAIESSTEEPKSRNKKEQRGAESGNVIGATAEETISEREQNKPKKSLQSRGASRESIIQEEDLEDFSERFILKLIACVLEEEAGGQMTSLPDILQSVTHLADVHADPDESVDSSDSLRVHSPPPVPSIPASRKTSFSSSTHRNNQPPSIPPLTKLGQARTQKSFVASSTELTFPYCLVAPRQLEASATSFPIRFAAPKEFSALDYIQVRSIDLRTVPYQYTNRLMSYRFVADAVKEAISLSSASASASRSASRSASLSSFSSASTSSSSSRSASLSSFSSASTSSSSSASAASTSSADIINPATGSTASSWREAIEAALDLDLPSTSAENIASEPTDHHEPIDFSHANGNKADHAEGVEKEGDLNQSDDGYGLKGIRDSARRGSTSDLEHVDLADASVNDSESESLREMNSSNLTEKKSQNFSSRELRRSMESSEATRMSGSIRSTKATNSTSAISPTTTAAETTEAKDPPSQTPFSRERRKRWIQGSFDISAAMFPRDLPCRIAYYKCEASGEKRLAATSGIFLCSSPNNFAATNYLRRNVVDNDGDAAVTDRRGGHVSNAAGTILASQSSSHSLTDLLPAHKLNESTVGHIDASNKNKETTATDAESSVGDAFESELTPEKAPADTTIKVQENTKTNVGKGIVAATTTATTANVSPAAASSSSAFLLPALSSMTSSPSSSWSSSPSSSISNRSRHAVAEPADPAVQELLSGLNHSDARRLLVDLLELSSSETVFTSGALKGIATGAAKQDDSAGQEVSLKSSLSSASSASGSSSTSAWLDRWSGVFDLDSAEDWAMARASMEMDPRLAQIRYRLVPSRISEVSFWTGYFTHVRHLRQLYTRRREFDAADAL